MERRLLKDFQIGLVEGMVTDAMKTTEPKNIFSKIAKVVGRKASSKGSQKDWNAVVRKGTLARDPIGSTSEARAKISRQSARRHIIEHATGALAAMDPEKLVDYNPKLSAVSPATRVAYAKFKIKQIKSEFQAREQEPPSEVSSVAGDIAGDDKPASRDSVKSKSSGKNEYVAAGAYSTQTSTESKGDDIKDFRSRTPIQEEPEIAPEELLQIVTSSTPTSQKSSPSTPSITLDTSTPGTTPELTRKDSLSIHDKLLKTPPQRTVTPTPEVTVEIEPDDAQPSTSKESPPPPLTPTHSPKPTPSKLPPGNWL